MSVPRICDIYYLSDIIDENELIEYKYNHPMLGNSFWELLTFIQMNTPSLGTTAIDVCSKQVWHILSKLLFVVLYCIGIDSKLLIFCDKYKWDNIYNVILNIFTCYSVFGIVSAKRDLTHVFQDFKFFIF